MGCVVRGRRADELRPGDRVLGTGGRSGRLVADVEHGNHGAVKLSFGTKSNRFIIYAANGHRFTVAG